MWWHRHSHHNTLIEQSFNQNGLVLFCFFKLCRLSRQVYDLKTSVKEIASRLDLIMTKLQLHDEIKAREATKQFAATYNVRLQHVADMDPLLTLLYDYFNVSIYKKDQNVF